MQGVLCRNGPQTSPAGLFNKFLIYNLPFTFTHVINPPVTPIRAGYEFRG